jgi:hypothetical protein
VHLYIFLNWYFSNSHILWFHTWKAEADYRLRFFKKISASQPLIGWENFDPNIIFSFPHSTFMVKWNLQFIHLAWQFNDTQTLPPSMFCILWWCHSHRLIDLKTRSWRFFDLGSSVCHLARTTNCVCTIQNGRSQLSGQ